jgi:excinuclease ABC subunit C
MAPRPILHTMAGVSALPRAVTVLPTTPGVYRFRDERGRVIYVGRATDLRRRVASYWGDLADRPHLRRMVSQIHRLEALVCDSVHEAAWLERNLLERTRPRWNRIRGGLEVPTYVVLEQRPSSAQLTVTHSQGEARHGDLVFGPYLGGNRTRTAVDGLDRVLCLDYTADRLGGFDRDMARVRGVTPSDRDERVRTAAAVLGRDATAFALVRSLLAARRDDAAAALAFEVAARVQEEIAALEWVMSEQKVTTTNGSDTDICGWADDVLVRLELRGGRLNRWQQRECAFATAAPLLAATPPEWAPFAERSAQLAHLLAETFAPSA